MFRVIRIKRVAIDKPAGHVVDFDSGSIHECAQNVCAYLWGRDIKNYLIIKLGDPLVLPDSSDLDDIYKYLIIA